MFKTVMFFLNKWPQDFFLEDSFIYFLVGGFFSFLLLLPFLVGGAPASFLRQCLCVFHGLIGQYEINFVVMYICNRP